MLDTKANYEFRFGGIGRLYGPQAMDRLKAAHICVVGIGGVGSWVAEALARSGLGGMTLVDLDDVCESNINRQIHALEGSIGEAKIEAMAKRCERINPDCEVRRKHLFLTEQTIEDVLDREYDFVADAIDSVKHKVALIAACEKRETPIITSGGAGGRIDPTQIQIADLSKSHNDKLLQRVRKTLRSEYGFPKNPDTKFKVDCVFSPEKAVYPEICDIDEMSGSRRLDCSSGYGAATHITGTFGFFMASEIVKRIANSDTT